MIEEKRSKYDTDPLDPEFVRRTEEMGGATRTVARDGDAPRPGISEEPTRRFEGPPTSYPSVFVPPTHQQPPTVNHSTFGASATPQVQPATPHLNERRPSSRHVTKLGVPENLALIAPYAPFYIGIVAALIELVVVPRHEARVRFHAAQGMALQLAMIAVTFLFKILGMITGTGFGGGLFWLASTIFLIVSMVRVWRGERHHIAPLDELTNRLNQQIAPRQ